jgi:hypothetical protein
MDLPFRGRATSKVIQAIKMPDTTGHYTDVLRAGYGPRAMLCSVPAWRSSHVFRERKDSNITLLT